MYAGEIGSPAQGYGKKTKAELNGERQTEANKFSTGLQIGGGDDKVQDRLNKSRMANNYQQMLDMRVQHKRDSEYNKKMQDRQDMQDALDQQMIQQENNNMRKNMYAPQPNGDMN